MATKASIEQEREALVNEGCELLRLLWTWDAETEGRQGQVVGRDQLELVALFIQATFEHLARLQDADVRAVVREACIRAARGVRS
jgi:hypothetical protein